MDWREFQGKTVNEAIQNAMQELGIPSDKLEYEVVEKESKGFLGIGSKPAIIKAKGKDTISDIAKNFIEKVLEQMQINASINVNYNEEENLMEINLEGEDMGILIGKRGQTLDSLQYLISLVVNKETESYVKVKLDTENYRERRKETLENLAKNIASKVKRIKKNVSLEPMNPYERRIIHSTLQNDKFVETHSEGEEPYRKVVVTLKKGYRDYNRGSRYGKSSYKKSNYSKENYKNEGFKKYEEDYRKYKESKLAAQREAQEAATASAE